MTTHVTYTVTTMARVSVRELKAHLSAILARVERGETVVVSKRNEPIAELRPVAVRRDVSVLGSPLAGFHLPESFFEPLSEAELAAFEGERP